VAARAPLSVGAAIMRWMSSWACYWRHPIVAADRLTRRRPSPWSLTSALLALDPLDREGRH